MTPSEASNLTIRDPRGVSDEALLMAFEDLLRARPDDWREHGNIRVPEMERRGLLTPALLVELRLRGIQFTT